MTGPSAHDGEPSEARRPRWEPIAPLAIVFMLAALAIAASGHWRGGIDLLGITMVSAGVARLVLPRARLGALAVRHRLLDAFLQIGTGTALIVLVYIVPTG